MTRLAAAALALAATAAAGPGANAQPRSLHWDGLTVEARLDGEGRLHVRELQTMVFTGDWNGGERRFDLRPGQEIDLERIVRVDPETGAETPLTRGDVARVDGWAWFGDDTVRWRSREPGDPPFDETPLTYRLDYTVTNVLVPEGDGRYGLAYEFAFADRPGPIERFSAELDLDPAWRVLAPSGGAPLAIHAEGLAPGTSPVLQARLEYLGEDRPAAVLHPIHPLLLLLPFLAAAGALGWLWRRFWVAERGAARRTGDGAEGEPAPTGAGSGRYDRLADLESPPDRAWLDEHVFSRRPEEVGALWDRAVGPPEVSALLARLVAEGRLGSRTEERGRKKVLHLELLEPRERFRGYERKLIDKLFFGGATETDTERVRRHYRDKGFDPASVIRPGLGKVLAQERRPADLEGRRRWLTPGLVLAVLLLGLLAAVFGSGPPLVLPWALPLSVVAYLAGLGYALLWRRQVRWPVWTAPLLLLPAVCGLVGIALFALGIRWLAPLSGGLLGATGAALLPLVLASSHLYRARTREPRRAVHLRRRLAHARAHFARELRRDTPALEDAWYPYLLALGLAKHVDSWTTRAADSTTSSSAGTWTALRPASGAGSTPSSPAWTGGGGAFGGAGASASWTAAVTGMAAGVAAPSSSGGGGSGGGGGGGGGSSGGGGGGGGW